MAAINLSCWEHLEKNIQRKKLPCIADMQKTVSYFWVEKFLATQIFMFLICLYFTYFDGIHFNGHILNK